MAFICVQLLLWSRKMPNIKQINNNKLEFYHGNWIIWKSHSADFKYGSYYLLKNDGTIDYVIENEDNIRVIDNIKGE